MPIMPYRPLVVLQPAKVVSVRETDRLVDVAWVGMEGTKRDVVVVGSPGSFSLPKVGDIGIVLGDNIHYFYIGTVEFNFKAKVDGTYVNKDTGKPQTFKEVEGGEIHLANVSTAARSWMNLDNMGNFSLMNFLSEGVSYFRNLRFLKFYGKTISSIANGVTFAVGTAMRNVPGIGEQPVMGESGGVALEALLQVAYHGIQTVRFHLGEIKDLVLGQVPELSSFGARLKAILEVTVGTTPLAVLKMDELGNIELVSTSSTICINGRPIAGILLGPAMGTSHPAVFGDNLLMWLASHQHPTSIGNTGVPVVPPDNSLLSTKVLLS